MNTLATLAAFGAAVDAWTRANDRESIDLARAALNAIAPPGIVLRPSQTASSVFVSFAGEEAATAEFFLRAYRGRKRCERMTARAWAAICAMSGVA